MLIHKIGDIVFASVYAVHQALKKLPRLARPLLRVLLSALLSVLLLLADLLLLLADLLLRQCDRLAPSLRRNLRRPTMAAGAALALLLAVACLFGADAPRDAVAIRTADGVEVCVATPESAQQALEQVIAFYAPTDDESVLSAEITSEIALEPTRQQRGRVVDADTAACLLLYGQREPADDPAPHVTVSVTREEAELLPLPYAVKEVDNDVLARGEQLIQVSGHDGEQKVTYEITEENGAEVARRAVEHEVITAAIDEVRQVGTTIYITSRSGASLRLFDSPLEKGTYYLSSYFGVRGSGFHAGVDLPTDYGAPIYAAADGVVTTASSSYYGYGMLIVIEHIDGFSTAYAHCSAINVQVGDRVQRGDVIGAVGATGRATCNHCHFEIRIDGTAVDPLSYMDY